MIITRGLQEVACLLPQELSFEPAARLLGWQMHEEKVLCATTIRSLSGPPARGRRSGGRLRHRNDAGATAHRHQKKHEPTPPGRLVRTHGRIIRQAEVAALVQREDLETLLV